MARVSDAEVKEIIDTDITTTPFITAANLLITQVLGSSGMSDAYLKEIERWYTAHLVTCRDPKSGGALRRHRIGDAEEWYETPSGSGKGLPGLHSTFYGQRVLELDYTGLMNSVGKKRAEATHINVTPDTGE